MKILHYLKTMRLEEGGVVRAVLDFCTALAGASGGASGGGHNVVLMTFDDLDVPKDWPRVAASAAWDQPGGRPSVVVLPRPSKPGGRFDAGAMAQVSAAVRAADVAHIHAVWIPSNMQVARAAARAGTPYIVTIHGMLDDWSMSQRTLKKKVYLALGGRKYLESAALVHSTAEFERRQSVKWYPKGRAVVAPLLFDLQPFRNLPGPAAARRAFPLAASDLPKVLFLSRVHEKKGLPHLIRACRLLKDAGRPVALLIAGTGEPAYVESLKTLVREQGLDNSTEFLGLVTGETKVSLFEAADLFVLPTSQENFGFAPIEAMASGTVAVTTKGVDIWPELEESGGAVIADPEPAPLSKVLGELLTDPDRRTAMGARARAWVLDRLDAGRVVGEYVAMYERAAEARRNH
ncbi:MAG: glycosyltransferase [Phycisphaerales bacterium]|nr:glycosyltransferase [Phycisphaerales bacterium]